MLEKLKENWQTIKEVVRDENDLTLVSFNTWIEPLTLVKVEDHVAHISFQGKSTEFAVNYLQKKYAIPFQVAIEEFIGVNVTVKFVALKENAEGVLFRHDISENLPQKQVYKNSNLNSKFTFDSFVVGPNNEFAHAASISVAQNPGNVYNPLFIFGGPGLGKTHLMHAIANYILNIDPSKKVVYVSSEVFMNELIEAIGMKNKTSANITSFKKKYRECDILLIDDIQFIIGRGESTETEFFNTFNFLYENNKQIVISSDKPPKDFIGLEERLRSRFECGLTVDITSPDYETRMAILRKKEELEGYNIDNEILKYIASNIKSNIRELEGALTKVNAFFRLQPSAKVDMNIVKKVLKDLINPEEENRITPEHIIKVVADHFGISVNDIKSPKQTKEVALPRHISIYLILLLTDLTQNDVGKATGGKNHSSVIYARKNIESLMKTDENIRNTVETIKKKILK